MMMMLSTTNTMMIFYTCTTSYTIQLLPYDKVQKEFMFLSLYTVAIKVTFHLHDS